MAAEADLCPTEAYCDIRQFVWRHRSSSWRGTRILLRSGGRIRCGRKLVKVSSSPGLLDAHSPQRSCANILFPSGERLRSHPESISVSGDERGRKNIGKQDLYAERKIGARGAQLCLSWQCSLVRRCFSFSCATLHELTQRFGSETSGLGSCRIRDNVGPLLLENRAIPVRDQLRPHAPRPAD